MKTSAAIMCAIAAMGAPPSMMVRTFGWSEEGEKKCALPDCNVMTKKGYCCADHCKQHKAILRNRRK